MSYNHDGGVGHSPNPPLPSRTTVEHQGQLLQAERAAENALVAPVPAGAAGTEQLVWAEFAEVGGGSTAWLNLLIALSSADEECTPGSTAYWDWAWNTYCLAQSELSDSDRRLSYAYDLGSLNQCCWCDERVVEHDQVECEHGMPYHGRCLDLWVADQIEHGGKPCHRVPAPDVDTV